MKSHWELFLDYYNKAPNALRDFIDKNVIGYTVDKLLLSNPKIISKEQKRDLVFVCNLRILGFSPLENLKKYIDSISLNDDVIKSIITKVQILYISEDDYKKFSNSGINHKERQLQMESLDKKKQFLIFNPVSIYSFLTITQKYDLHKEDTYKKFAITVGDIILGFYRIEDTVPLLQQELGIDPRTAALLGADVLDFLAPLSDPNWQPPREGEDEEESAPIEPIVTPLPAVNTPAPTPDPKPAGNNPLHYEPVHTSAGQDSLRQPLSDIPSYNTPKKPETERSNIELPPQWGR